MVNLDEDRTLELARELVAEGRTTRISLLSACQHALRVVGERYERRDYALAALIMGGELSKEVMEIVQSLDRVVPDGESPGLILLGTVAGDIHDLGKDVVSFMLDVNHFEVHDLGVDVPADTFVQKVGELKPQVVGMSGFLTMAYEQMKKTVDALEEAGLRDGVKIMIGGAIMDDSAAKFIGADAYGADASAPVRLCQNWTGGK
jgi:5-methyltetrahydrofolate--homocysteine methyltransferase